MRRRERHAVSRDRARAARRGRRHDGRHGVRVDTGPVPRSARTRALASGDGRGATASARRRGPSLGGWMSEHLGWRSTFLINLPVGAAALYFIWAHLPSFQRPHDGEVKIDWLGAGLVARRVGRPSGVYRSRAERRSDRGQHDARRVRGRRRDRVVRVREARHASHHSARSLQGRRSSSRCSRSACCRAS